MGSKSIPDRWIPYKACGKVIEGTRIICFKVPLRRVVQTAVVSPNEIWDIKTLLKAIPKLRAVIDLTNTARYYDAQELKSAGILHTKLLMPGRIIPPATTVTQFFNAVDTYLEVDNDSLIGVHCTHGLNRTGYMVCRYMRDRLGIPAAEAIKRFEEARGYKIERNNYIADIMGMPPPAPVFGQETIVKPIKRSQVEYQSPLNEDNNEDDDKDNNEDDDEDNRSESRKKKYYGSGHRRNRRKKFKDKESYATSRQSSYVYDYKYDY
ncbi:RNA/RNP complex-1-interacting phosphatase homolog [Bicyclus anynana]|uniref:RNA/RNP complex-1-interacting phosphatase homolog n=1 Tax=Bicyclus anynana TaxID=110368 RepID=A0A6J1N4X4_BICAN|nr:RNA/RNP complex-1-interacting phosphatase homolog [Bicyclus anynana]